LSVVPLLVNLLLSVLPLNADCTHLNQVSYERPSIAYAALYKFASDLCSGHLAGDGSARRSQVEKRFIL